MRASNHKPNPPPGVAVKSTPRDADSNPWTEVPAPTLTAFRNYTVPKPLQSSYSLLHGQYGKLGANNPLKCTLQDGENVLDIVLP
ncbi:MAG: hypothetical protein C0467_31540 [Planctomycetaceae bacterium]|nr:hypothetical protein [Planctomycetaceae bacterium]